MAKKRLTFNVEERLHSTLKQKAAEQGVPLGALCSEALEAFFQTSEESEVEIDPKAYHSLPLDVLRSEALRLSSHKPRGWERCLEAVKSEIVKRYVVR